MRKRSAVLAVCLALGVAGCGYNTFQRNDELIKANWSEVLNQYQRRADLIPNLVNTVKGFAAQEKEVLLGVTNARAKVGGIQEVTRHLAEHFPPIGDDRNELPDKPVVL